MQMVDLGLNCLGACAKLAIGVKPPLSEKEQSCWVQEHRPHPARELGIWGCTHPPLGASAGGLQDLAPKHQGCAAAPGEGW